MDTKTDLSWNATGTALVAGFAAGELLYSDTGLSFWGGIDPQTGEVIDRVHPLSGQCVTGKILAIPSGRGSCTGSSVMLELIVNGRAPAGMIFAQREEILSLGAIVADEMFGQSIPMVNVGPLRFEELRGVRRVSIDDEVVTELRNGDAMPADSPSKSTRPPATGLALTDIDRSLLAGQSSKAAEVAMRIIVRMADVLKASELIDVTRAHIDGCIYTGPACLRFAEMLCDWGAKVRVPTTLNAISVDQMHWRSQGTDPALAEPASALADAYVRMGAQPTFTCAPYQLGNVPEKGEQIVWAESNAVVYANSVLGARTMKYPDYLDICIALTGRAPLAGCHVESERKATLHIAVDDCPGTDDLFYPLLGYHVGLLAPNEIPVISGLEHAKPSLDDLKAFGAAFGTSSAAPMFHITGVTPEAATLGEASQGGTIPTVTVTRADLAISWRKLNMYQPGKVDLIALGNPHFSYDEFVRLAEQMAGKTRHPDVPVVVATGRAIRQQVRDAGLERVLADFGATIVVDACWCMIIEPVIPVTARSIITNSGKYAHYGPGLSGRELHFASLACCVEAAVSGQASGALPGWLTAVNDTVERR